MGFALVPLIVKEPTRFIVIPVGSRRSLRTGNAGLGVRVFELKIDVASSGPSGCAAGNGQLAYAIARRQFPAALQRDRPDDARARQRSRAGYGDCGA